MATITDETAMAVAELVGAKTEVVVMAVAAAEAVAEAVSATLGVTVLPSESIMTVS